MTDKIMLFGLVVLLSLVTLNGALALWYDSDYRYKMQIDIENKLSHSRTNVTTVFNITSGNVGDCTVLMVDNSDMAIYPYYNVTVKSAGTYCTVRLYANYTNGETKTFYAYYGNNTPVSNVPTFTQALYEKLWATDLTITGITELYDEWGTRAIGATTCDIGSCVGVAESGGNGGTAIWNLTNAWIYDNRQDSYFIRERGMWNGSDTANNGFFSHLTKMVDVNNFYEAFSFTGDAGGGGGGLYLRNKSTTYQSMVDYEAFKIVRNFWYYQDTYYLFPQNYSYSIIYNTTHSASVDKQWGQAFNTGRSLGLRYYSGDQTDAYVAFFKELEVGAMYNSLQGNRNQTVNIEDETTWEESTTTTTTSSTTTTTPPEISYCEVNDTDVVEGEGVQIHGSVSQGSFPLDLFWADWSIYTVASQPAVPANNWMDWNTSGYYGNYSLTCYVNDTSVNYDSADAGYVNVESTTTSSTSTTTTTFSTSSTTTPETTTIDLGNAERVSYFCQADSWLVRNKTWWNATAPAWVTEYNMTYCEYNCSETLLGTRCNFQPSVNIASGIGIIAILLFGFGAIIKLVRI